MRIATAPDSCKVYTPAVLADSMVHALGDDPCALWLEPSHGTGVFIDAIARLGAPKERIVAIDPPARISNAIRRIIHRNRRCLLIPAIDHY